MTEVNTIQIYTKQASFKFINEYDPNDKSYYNILIHVDNIMYSNGKVYYIITPTKKKNETTFLIVM
jgi:hypothetical protein